MNETLIENDIEIDNVKMELEGSAEELKQELFFKEQIIDTLRSNRSSSHSHVEFALFGVGMCIIGMIISLAIMWNMKKTPNQFTDDQEGEEEEEDNVFGK